jgi:hypothetical protein
MKPVETVPGMGGGQRRMMERVNSSMIHLICCNNFCKCRNVPPPQHNNKKRKNIYMYTHTHIYICTMEFYSVIRKNEIMWFEGKWMQLEGIMLSEITHTQKHKGYVLSHVWKIDPKIYTKTSMIIYKLKHDHIHT